MNSAWLRPPIETGCTNMVACKNKEMTKKETNLMIVADWPQPNGGEI
jgi:hypothetical protein